MKNPAWINHHVCTRVSRVSSTPPATEVTGLSLTSPFPLCCSQQEPGSGCRSIEGHETLKKVVMLSSEHQRSGVCMWGAFQAPQYQRSAYVAPSLHLIGPAALSLLRAWIKPNRERACSPSHIRPPGGSGTHSQAACSGRMGKAGQKLLRQGKQPGYPRIRNHPQSILPPLRQWENCP